MRQYFIFGSLFFVIFLVNLEITAVNLTLSHMADFFEIDLAKTTWVLNIYLAMFAVFLVVGGYLSDCVGNRFTIVLGLVLFTASSLYAALAMSFSSLIFARAVQGAGAALMLPSTTATFYLQFKHNRRGLAMGLVSSAVGGGVSTGPWVGGMIVHYFNWQMVFLLNVPIGVILLVLVMTYLQKTVESHMSISKQMVIDLLLFSLPCVAVCILLFNGLGHHRILVLLPLIVFGIFLYRNYRALTPVLPLYLFRFKRFRYASMIRFLVSICYFSLLFLLAIFSTNVLGLSVSEAGFLYLPMTIVSAAVAPVVGKLYDQGRLSKRFSLTFYLIIFVLLVGFFGWFVRSVWFTCLVLVAVGGIYGLIYTLAFKESLVDIPGQDTSKATAIFYLVNMVGSIAGIAYTSGLMNYLRPYYHLDAMLPRLLISFIPLILGALLLSRLNLFELKKA